MHHCVASRLCADQDLPTALGGTHNQAADSSLHLQPTAAHPAHAAARQPPPAASPPLPRQPRRAAPAPAARLVAAQQTEGSKGVADEQDEMPVAPAEHSGTRTHLLSKYHNASSNESTEPSPRCTLKPRTCASAVCCASRCALACSSAAASVETCCRASESCPDRPSASSWPCTQTPAHQNQSRAHQRKPTAWSQPCTAMTVISHSAMSS